MIICGANMTEVVVTALGITRNKNVLPYATQTITADEVSKTGNSNFVDGLSGKVAGLQISQTNTIDGSTNIVLRDNKSITQSNQALFVVDGVPFDNTFTRSYIDKDNISKNLLNFGATHNLASNLTAGGTLNYSGVDGVGRYGTNEQTANGDAYKAASTAIGADKVTTKLFWME